MSTEETTTGTPPVRSTSASSTAYVPRPLGGDKPADTSHLASSVGFWGSAKHLLGNHGGKLGLMLGVYGSCALAYAFYLVLTCATLALPVGWLALGAALIGVGLVMGVSSQFCK